MLRPFLMAAAMSVAAALPAQAFDAINKSTFTGLAVDGYDSTAYFTDARHEEGSSDHTFEWKGATWRFASKTDRDLFAAAPGSYAPQYGGYCSNQMSLGNLSDIDPGVWLIHDGKLYLFGHDAGRIRWETTGVADRIKDADRHWQAYLADQ